MFDVRAGTYVQAATLASKFNVTAADKSEREKVAEVVHRAVNFMSDIAGHVAGGYVLNTKDVDFYVNAKMVLSQENIVTTATKAQIGDGMGKFPVHVVPGTVDKVLKLRDVFNLPNVDDVLALSVSVYSAIQDVRREHGAVYLAKGFDRQNLNQHLLKSAWQ